jgi:hypothetical protein
LERGKTKRYGKVHSDEALKDLSIAYHVNYDTFSIPKISWNAFWVWHQYSMKKAERPKAMFAFADLRYSLKESILNVKRLLLP